LDQAIRETVKLTCKSMMKRSFSDRSKETMMHL